uniref:Uncharacterized protein n=1 Tax=Glossina pallidipes TaxID=7398 RepID=A0A1A9ZPQ7_GLOPL
MARLRRCCCGVNFGFSGSGAGGAGGTRWGGGAGAIVGFKIIRDSCRGIQGPSASNGGLITRRVVCITLCQKDAYKEKYLSYARDTHIETNQASKIALLLVQYQQ